MKRIEPKLPIPNLQIPGSSPGLGSVFSISYRDFPSSKNQCAMQRTATASRGAEPGPNRFYGRRLGAFAGRSRWCPHRGACTVLNRQIGACLGAIGGRGAMGRGGCHRRGSTFLNGTSVPAMPLQAPARPRYVTNRPPSGSAFSFASELLATNATTLPVLSEANASITSPVAILGP